ncbi:hypothetical protein PHYSODRAFT_310488 [Phytophthora sojae]|uniref:Uncharacterized protein n=1 Tax=Phytophthora sojae (strain P6497) TaxID=1094619 RepID=G4YNY0_PHYSP|nr:hypothetical protein PHYSODRAFT_310488 [Phytophthora sojae]EGZ30687.1 hypothetical protein PHYSODRAFT_310488 [Phytophthora sojae]|eukprot:XP_009517962.1 hypothetical protein PHYSODRAFT_310488 [Phytophthora sojae]
MVDSAPQKKRKRKYRKSTHAILKEEKEALLLEIDTLTARLEDLKTKTFGSPDGEEERDRRCKDKMVENRLLRRAVQDQQDQFTSVHALTNEYSLTDTEVGSALHRFIHLDKGESSRRTALRAIKDGVIARGLHLLQRRKPQIHQPWRPMHDDHAFEASIGDYYASSFAIMPFKRFNTVQQAFAALITFNADVAQNRLVTTTQSGHQMESNTVFFSKLVGEGSEIGQQRGYGIVVCDFVDEDDRYPFHSEARVRRDLSSVLEISSYVRQNPTGAKGEQEIVVVLTRWVHTRLHYPGFTIRPDDWDEMCQNTERWMQLLRPPLLETLV